MKSGVCLCVLLVSAAVWSSCGLQSGRERREGSRTSLGLSKRRWQAASKVQLPRGLVSRLLSEGKGSFTYRLGDGRRRRGSGGEQKCGLSESTLLEHMPQSLSESAEAIQASWVGKDEIVIVASDSTNGDRTTVWIGLPKTYGTFLFSSHPDVIKGAVSPSSLQTSNAHKQTVVVVSTARDKLWVSRNAGRAWDSYKLPTADFAAERDLYLSSVDPRHMVLLSKHNELYVSDNWGETWHRIVAGKGAGGVQSAQLAVRNKTEYLYYTTGTPSSPFLPLYRMDIGHRKTEVIDSHAYRFSVDGQYLYVSRKNHTSNILVDLHSRRLYVSKNYDHVSSDKVVFTEVLLPSLKPEQYYVIMATHESGAFIHVAKNTSYQYGELYTSDSSGSRFSLSLPNHLYKVVNLPLGIHFAIDDFYEVKSSRGVYITTSVPKGNDHVTMITYDNGGEWQRIRPPSSAAHCRLPSCSLHLHLHYSQMVSRRYNISRLTGPLSVPSAPGIIIAHGNVGAVRNNSKPRLYLSSDGGYTWTDPGLPQGTYVYGIADYGNVILVSPDAEHVEFVWFSHNRGSCFVREQIDSTSVFALTRGLLMDPSAASLFAFMMGVEGEGQDDEWRMITINFGSLLSRECQPQDYYSVTEHVASSTCLLGYKSVYNLTKPAAVCYNERSYDYHPMTIQKCPCSYTDYECDYGFIREGDECKKDPKFNLAAVCPPGQSHYQESTSGFRQIPGDLCVKTDENRDLLKQTTHPCTSHEQESGIDSAGGSGSSHKGGPTAVRVLGAIAIILATVVAAGVCFYAYLRCKTTPKSSERVVYQKVPVSDSRFSATEESSDEDLIDAS